MVTIKNLLPLIAGACLLAASCGESKTTDGTTVTDTATAGAAGRSIGLEDIAPSPDFPGATLTLGPVKETANGDSVKVSFAFNVKNYELKSQTSDAKAQQCNNSAQGQHIHFIIDNKPYVALYEPKHEVTVAKNSEHHVLAFLSRSYHESLKNKEASLLYHFKIDENGKLQKLPEPSTPMVFYSRPKGDYLGKDTENLLFDFYIWNTTLSDAGHHVRAHIKGDGVDTTMHITNWKPYFLKNMPMGKPSITLTLVDKDGNKVDGPETEVTREFNLSQDEPMTR